MSQQLANGSFYNGSVTVTYRMSGRYAVINPPFSGLHLKPQDEVHLEKRKKRWQQRNTPPEEERKQHKTRMEEMNVGEAICSLRKAVKTAAAGNQFESPQHMEHQPGYPQSGKPESIQQSQSTAVRSQRFVLTVYYLYPHIFSIEKTPLGGSCK